MADDSTDNIPFSPILIMEFIRQTTVAHCLNGDSADIATRFKINKTRYTEIAAFPLQAQFIRLYPEYDEATEILTVKTDETLLNRFKEQKSQVEIAGKYEAKFAERYKQFIEVVA